MLYIVTPCSRPENLLQIEKSIFESYFKNTNLIIDTNFKWVIVYDKSIGYPLTHVKSLEGKIPTNHVLSPNKNALAGHSHRNYFLKNYKSIISNPINDWVYFLDDDTILHENFFSVIFQNLHLDLTAILFNQLNADGTPRLYASNSSIKVGHIDMGQYIVNLNKIPENLKFDENDYCADGVFIEELFNQTENKQNFVVINEFISHYNKLRP